MANQHEQIARNVGRSYRRMGSTVCNCPSVAYAGNRRVLRRGDEEYRADALALARRLFGGSELRIFASCVFCGATPLLASVALGVPVDEIRLALPVLLAEYGFHAEQPENGPLWPLREYFRAG